MTDRELLEAAARAAAVVDDADSLRWAEQRIAELEALMAYVCPLAGVDGDDWIRREFCTQKREETK